MAWSFKNQQVALVAGVQKAVTPLASCRTVEIINTTAGDLTVQTDPNDATTAFIVMAGYPKAIDLKERRFDPYVVAFYLTAAAGGNVVLIWS